MIVAIAVLDRIFPRGFAAGQPVMVQAIILARPQQTRPVTTAGELLKLERDNQDQGEQAIHGNLFDE